MVEAGNRTACAGLSSTSVCLPDTQTSSSFLDDFSVGVIAWWHSVIKIWVMTISCTTSLVLSASLNWSRSGIGRALASWKLLLAQRMPALTEVVPGSEEVLSPLTDSLVRPKLLNWERLTVP